MLKLVDLSQMKGSDGTQAQGLEARKLQTQETKRKKGERHVKNTRIVCGIIIIATALEWTFGEHGKTLSNLGNLGLIASLFAASILVASFIW